MPPGFLLLQETLIFATPTENPKGLERWCGSSVGRAKDWKSLCRRFNPGPHHALKASLETAGFFYSATPWHQTLLYVIYSPAAFHTAQNVLFINTLNINFKLQVFDFIIRNHLALLIWLLILEAGTNDESPFSICFSLSHKNSRYCMPVFLLT